MKHRLTQPQGISLLQFFLDRAKQRPVRQEFSQNPLRTRRGNRYDTHQASDRRSFG